MGNLRASHARSPDYLHVPSILARPARSLEPETAGEMGGRFSHDFSRVRIHDDMAAAESARAMHASAYTVGSDVVFGRVQYQPRLPPGRTPLAPELAHPLARQPPPT